MLQRWVIVGRRIRSIGLGSGIESKEAKSEHMSATGTRVSVTGCILVGGVADYRCGDVDIWKSC